MENPNGAFEVAGALPLSPEGKFILAVTPDERKGTGEGDVPSVSAPASTPNPSPRNTLQASSANDNNALRAETDRFDAACIPIPSPAEKRSSRSGKLGDKKSSRGKKKIHRRKGSREHRRKKSGRSREGSKDEGRRKSSFMMKGVEKIGNYLVMKRIGKGAMGTVYMATNQMDGRTHAIKRMSMKKIPESERAAVEFEIKMLKHLSHPNIVKYVDTIREDRYLNIVLEYVPNGSLSTMLEKFGVFSETLAAHYISQTVEALEYLHQQGIIHRDIKGGNILADSEGIVKLTDFGVATRFRKDFSGGEESNLPAGTMFYMAPEIVKMSSPPTYSCDIWSVGATVIELLTGEPPYSNEEGMSVCYRIVNDDHPPLPVSVSAACRNFLMECFQKDPDLRISAKALKKHDWLELHRASVREMRRKKAPMTPKDTKLGKRREVSKFSAMDDLGSPATGMSPSSPKTANWNVTGLAVSTLKADLLEKYKEDERDSNFDDLEIDLPDAPDLALDGAQEQVLDLEITFEDEADTFTLDVGDQLRYHFENLFRDLDPTLTKFDERRVLGALDRLRELTINNPRGCITAMVVDIVLQGGTGMMILMDLLRPSSTETDVSRGVVEWVNTLLLHDSDTDSLERKEGKLGSPSRRSSPARQKRSNRPSKFQERLCVLGMTGRILKYCQKSYPLSIRLEAAQFARHMCGANTYTRKMLCACGGLKVLVALFDCSLFDRPLPSPPVSPFSGPISPPHRLPFNRTLPRLPSSPTRTLPRLPSSPTRSRNNSSNPASPPQRQPSKLTDSSSIKSIVSVLGQSSSSLNSPSLNSPSIKSSMKTRFSPNTKGRKEIAKVTGQKRHLIILSVECITKIINNTDCPKDDFCRLLCEYGLLPRLAYGFAELRRAGLQEGVEKLVALFAVFAGADVLVRRRMAREEVIKPMLKEIHRMSDTMLETVIKALKMLCGLKDPTALAELEKAGVVKEFVLLLDHKHRDIYNQILLCLDMLLDISPRRVEIAVTAGLIPRLLRISTQEATMHQVVKKLLCSLPMSSLRVKVELRNNSMVPVYLTWLSDPAWRTDVLSALRLWLREDPQYVAKEITDEDSLDALLAVTRVQPSMSLRQLSSTLATIHDMTDNSRTLARALSTREEFVTALIKRLIEPTNDDLTGTHVALHTTVLQILDNLAHQSTNLVSFVEEHNILETFNTVAREAKKLGKIKLWQVAENSGDYLKLRIQSKKLYSDDQKSPRSDASGFSPRSNASHLSDVTTPRRGERVNQNHQADESGLVNVSLRSSKSILSSGGSSSFVENLEPTIS